MNQDWLDIDFATEFCPGVQSHYAGILLVNTKPGLKYSASAPGYAIRAVRASKSDRFRVSFYRNDASDSSACEQRIAGHDRDSIERCIIEFIDRPKKRAPAPTRSILSFPKNSTEPFRLPKKETARRIKLRATAEPSRPVDMQWPPIPDKPATVNARVVKQGMIYRLTTREYCIGVWRRDEQSAFCLSISRHGSPSKRNFEVGETMASVHEFVVAIARAPSLLYWKSQRPESTYTTTSRAVSPTRQKTNPRQDTKMIGTPRLVRRDK